MLSKRHEESWESLSKLVKGRKAATRNRNPPSLCLRPQLLRLMRSFPVSLLRLITIPPSQHLSLLYRGCC